jgi:hypothetical protein
MAGLNVLSTVIASSVATKQSSSLAVAKLDCFASHAMTDQSVVPGWSEETRPGTSRFPDAQLRIRGSMLRIAPE